MVNSIGSNLPPSVQAVNNARSGAETRGGNAAGRAANPADEVSLSSEAQELGDINRAASDVRQALQDNPSETLSGSAGSFESFL